MMHNYCAAFWVFMATVFIGSATAHAQENCGAALNLEDADIREVVDEMALRTGRKFVLDPRVQGRVTIKSGPETSLCR